MRALTVITFCFLVVCSVSGRNTNSAADNPVHSYVDKYKQIAISEMQRTGIPASIKLAQGILESNSGRSTLARQANNHFGIKCGKYWDGDTYYREDDDYKNGKLIKSCFRKFEYSEASYIEHSNFLMNPGSQYRYGFLFELEPTDYESWAKGLKKSGYATDPSYANKLIAIIEKYQLYMFDTGVPVEMMDEELVVVEEEESKFVKVEKTKKTTRGNRLSIEVADNIHLVKRDETMAMIARKYNVDLNLFYFQNRMPLGSQPREGEELKIEGYFHWGKKPKIIKTKKKSLPVKKHLFREEDVTISIQ